ncbi:ABC transporter substrate-binding protein [Kushneria sp. EE4]
MKAMTAILAGLLTMLLATCSQAATPDDQLIIALRMNNILSLDPAAATGNDIALVNANLYDTLIELDPQEQTRVLPGLAREWEIAEDGSRLSFSLREDARFHSGNPVTARDVAWSFERVMMLNLAMATAWKALGYTRDNIGSYMTVRNDHEFELELPQRLDPRLVLYTLATSPSAFILDRQKVLAHEQDGDLGHGWLTTNAAGSGAFRLHAWVPQDRIIMTAHEAYWQGSPALKRVVLRNLKESQTMRLMVERGDIDVAIGMSVPDIRSLEHSTEVETQTTPRGTLYYVAVSMKHDILADREVRKAIRGSIDYQGINDSIMPYYGKFHQRPIKLDLPATLPDPMYGMTPEQARDLLAKAGYDNGFQVTIRALNESPFINVATSLQNSLARIGIRARIITGTGNQIYGAMRDRSYDILVGRGGGGMAPHPDANLRPLLYNPDNDDAARLTNFQGWRTAYQNERINELIDKALIEPDATRQNDYYREVQALYDEDVGAIYPFSQMVNTVVVRREVANYVDDPSAVTRFRQVEKVSP